MVIFCKGKGNLSYISSSHLRFHQKKNICVIYQDGHCLGKPGMSLDFLAPRNSWEFV